jgi:thiol-disulfide isomerase/thioredoxin
VRSLFPRPFLLALTLLLFASAVVAIELRLGVPVATRENGGKEAASPAGGSERRGEQGEGTSPVAVGRTTLEKKFGGSVARIERKEAQYRRAEEITAPTGFINTDGVSINEARGEKVVLLDFWTYACFNCQNTQPHLNAWHEEYSDEGLFIIGVHTPEFGFERDQENVERAVQEAGIEYPVVLDNDYATWDAYDQRYWPAMYLIDVDGFVRYRHFGEGAYEQTEDRIQELLAERVTSNSREER